MFRDWQDFMPWSWVKSGSGWFSLAGTPVKSGDGYTFLDLFYATIGQPQHIFHLQIPGTGKEAIAAEPDLGACHHQEIKKNLKDDWDRRSLVFMVFPRPGPWIRPMTCDNEYFHVELWGRKENMRVTCYSFQSHCDKIILDGGVDRMKEQSCEYVGERGRAMELPKAWIYQGHINVHCLLPPEAMFMYLAFATTKSHVWAQGPVPVRDWVDVLDHITMQVLAVVHGLFFGKRLCWYPLSILPLKTMFISHYSHKPSKVHFLLSICLTSCSLYLF